MNSVELTQEDRSRWNDLLFSSLNGSYISSIPYEYAKKDSGREITTFIFQEEDKDIAGAHYSIKKSRGNIILTADILSGFVFKNNPDAGILSGLINHFTQWAVERNASYARITPWLPKTVEGNQSPDTQLFYDEMMVRGFRPIHDSPHTYWIDLSLDETRLLGNMRPQTRSKIRKAMKSALISEKYDKPGKEEIEIFWELYNKLGQKKNFNTLSEYRFKNEVTSLLDTGLASLFFLRFQGVIVNVALASNFGRAMYFHGALNSEYREFNDCPSPGHLAQWEIIRNMKLLGLKTYDMAFCPGPVPVKDHPQFDMWRFKYGFGGKHVEFLPVFGKILKPVKGRLFQYIKYRV